jgi:alanine racemase
MRATHLEVDVSQFYENIKIIKEYVNGKEIMPVIKANAYGTYLNRNMDVLSHFPIVAVALVQEGVDLREDGYEGDIFILNQPSIGDIEDIVNYHLTVGLSDLTFLEECIEKEASFPIHLEIETGMNRTGLNVEQIDQFLDLLSHSNLTLEGLYSHFSSVYRYIKLY